VGKRLKFTVAAFWGVRLRNGGKTAGSKIELWADPVGFKISSKIRSNMHATSSIKTHFWRPYRCQITT
jgi:hypothetical protein